MANLAFLGLGQMGMPMATRLLEAGHHLTVRNRTSAEIGPLVEGILADSPIGPTVRAKRANIESGSYPPSFKLTLVTGLICRRSCSSTSTVRSFNQGRRSTLCRLAPRDHRASVSVQ
jgi:hypothetical protein